MLAWSCSNARPVFEPVPACPSCIYQGNRCCNRHVVPILLLESHVQINCWYSTAVALLEVVNAYAEKNQDCGQNPNYEVSRAFTGIQQAIEANKQIVAMEHMTQTHNS
jgi:hypothetical protein